MGEHNPLVHAIAGGVGGVIGATCTYPFDIIKTRMQVKTFFFFFLSEIFFFYLFVLDFMIVCCILCICFI